MHPTAFLTAAFLGALTSTSVLATTVPTPSASPDPEPKWQPSNTEIGWCLVPWNMDDCVKARGHAMEAYQVAKKLFGKRGQRNGKPDAFRHCYWSARMTIDLGPRIAWKILNNHEDGSKEPEENQKMDRANNMSGLQIGLDAGGSTKKAKYENAKEACQDETASGMLETLN